MQKNYLLNKSILVIGDPILDIYVYGQALGKSLETPTIVAKKTKTKYSFGGASLVVRNILNLGSKVEYIFPLGDDENSKHYKDFDHKNLKKHVIKDSSKGSTAKKRYWIDDYKLLQMDDLDNKDISREIENKIIDKFDENIDNCDLVIISDYRHGLLTERLSSEIIEKTNLKNKKLFVDSQISHRKSNHHFYKGAYMLFLSENEAKVVDPDFDVEIRNFTKLLDFFPNSRICVKLGEKGSVYLNGEEVIFSPAAENVQVNDTCGAGDAFMAACSVGNINNPVELMTFANIWAGLSTEIHGAEPPVLSDLHNKLNLSE